MVAFYTQYIVVSAIPTWCEPERRPIKKSFFFQRATDAAAAHRDLSHYTSLTLLTIAGLRID